MVKQYCTNCGHDWFYTGKSVYITCPNCYTYNWKLTEDEIEVHKRQMGIYRLEGEESEDGERLTEPMLNKNQSIKKSKDGDASN